MDANQEEISQKRFVIATIRLSAAGYLSKMEGGVLLKTKATEYVWISLFDCACAGFAAGVPSGWAIILCEAIGNGLLVLEVTFIELSLYWRRQSGVTHPVCTSRASMR